MADRDSKWLAHNQATMNRVLDQIQKSHESLNRKVNAMREQHQHPESPYAGEMVLYCMGEGPSAGERRPAIVVRQAPGQYDERRCDLKVICIPDVDNTGVLDLRNVPAGDRMNCWMPMPGGTLRGPDPQGRSLH